MNDLAFEKDWELSEKAKQDTKELLYPCYIGCLFYDHDFTKYRYLAGVPDNAPYIEVRDRRTDGSLRTYIIYSDMKFFNLENAVLMARMHYCDSGKRLTHAIFSSDNNNIMKYRPLVIVNSHPLPDYGQDVKIVLNTKSGEKLNLGVDYGYDDA